MKMATRDNFTIILLFLAAQVLLCSAQYLLDNKDDTFVVGFPAQDPRKSTSGSNRLYLTADEDAQVFIRIPQIKSNQIVTLKPGGPIVVTLPGKVRMGSITGKEKKGIRIWANSSISVYGLSLVDQSSEGYLALPLRLLGTEYLVPTYAPIMNAFVMVVAVHNATEVTFVLKLSGQGFITYNIYTFRNGDSFKVTLDALESFQIIADSNAGSLTGTRVISNKVVSVYSGNDCANVPLSKATCDHLVEQIPPITAWGRTFLVKSTAQRTAGDFFHILASQNKTRIEVHMVGSSVVRNLNAGDVYEFDANYTSSYTIVANKPSLVIQYAKGQTVDNSQFAPFMSIIPSTDQFSNDYTLVVPDASPKPFVGYATIVAQFRKTAGIKIKSSTKLGRLSWNSIPNSIYSAATVQLIKGQYRFYHISPLEKISVMFYGTGNFEAFGYSAGFRISRPLRQGCLPSQMVPADRRDNDCDGKIDEELLNGIDDDRDGRIDEDLATPIPQLIVPPSVNETKCPDDRPARLMSSTQYPVWKAYGLCSVRGDVKILHRDISISKQRNMNCWTKQTREWTFTDGCQNVIKKTQELNVFTPVLLQVKFPPDRINESCPASSFDVDLNSFGLPKVTSRCAGNVKMVYRDSDWNVLKKCGYTPVLVYRTWTVTDLCKRVFFKTQTLSFKKRGVRPLIHFSSAFKMGISSGQEENITLECSASGVPKPSITWVLPGGQQINASHYIRETEILDDLTQRTRLKKPQADGSLLISDTRALDSGVYRCIASNARGNDSRSVNVTVLDDLVEVDASITLPDEEFADDLLDTESDRYRKLYDTFQTELTKIFINMTGFQEVKILGFRNGSVKVLFRVVIKTKDKDEKPEVIVKKVGKRLSVKVKGGQVGSYKVIPTVQLQEKPPPPKDLQASDIKDKAVHISWLPPELHVMFSVSGYLLQFKRFGKADNTWTTYATVRGDNHRIDGLDSGTSYIIRLKAKNKYGHSQPSSNLEVSTLKGRSGAELALMIVIPILILAFIIAVALFFVKKKRKSKGFHRADMKDDCAVRYCRDPKGINGIQFETSVTWREIPRDSLEMGRVLGEGEFGTVIEGMLTEGNEQKTRCAVKKLKRTATESDLKDLLNEVDIMVQVGQHPNIVNLIGACSDADGPLLVIVEFAAKGNLLRYLQENNSKNYDNLQEYTLHIPARERLRIACDVAKGMSHLENMRCVHRDLAARNVLLDDCLNAKVSDFGLSRDVYASNVYEKTTGGKLPAKWMAIESIDAGLYTTKSDVWSFGVLLWEIETGGCIPYPTFSVLEMLNALKQGYRMEQPAHCPEILYKMMQDCWNSDPSTRPTFDDLCLQIQNMRDYGPEMFPSYEDMSNGDDSREPFA